jgi:hypothetical protein
MSFQQVVCFVHGVPFPKSTCHLHHEAPRMAGGGDEASNLIWLCANCHNTAHRVAQLHEQGKTGEISDILDTLFASLPVKKRFQQVVNEMLEAVTLAKHTGKGKSKTMVELYLPNDTYNRLKLAVSDFRVDGKKLGISKYVEALVINHLKQKGYM